MIAHEFIARIQARSDYWDKVPGINDVSEDIRYYGGWVLVPDDPNLEDEGWHEDLTDVQEGYITLLTCCVTMVMFPDNSLATLETECYDQGAIWTVADDHQVIFHSEGKVVIRVIEEYLNGLEIMYRVS